MSSSISSEMIVREFRLVGGGGGRNEPHTAPGAARRTATATGRVRVAGEIDSFPPASCTPPAGITFISAAQRAAAPWLSERSVL